MRSPQPVESFDDRRAILARAEVVVPGIEDESEDLRVGYGQEAVDLRRGLHPTGRVMMKDGAQPRLFPHRPRYRFGAPGVACHFSSDKPIAVGDPAGVERAHGIGGVVVGHDDEWP